MRQGILTLVFILVNISGFAQKYDNTWLTGFESFGARKFIINFSNDTLVRKTINWREDAEALRTYFSISDEVGDFQFFTEGHKIFNASFQLLTNGDSINFGRFWQLNSGYSATGYIILPDVINSNKFFLLYTRLEYDENIRSIVYCDRFQYSLIDISDGKGRVVEKNIQLISDTLETHNMAAAKHANGRDWWIPVKESDSNSGYMFLLSPTGVELKDTFKVGKKSLDGLGQSVFSPDGTKFISYNGVDLEFGEYLDIYDFDRCTGILSNQRQFNYLDSTVWSGGVAVSPNSRYLYLSNTLRLYQFDLWADDIIGSIDTIAEYDGYADPFPSTFYLLQLAPDGKIYMSCNNGTKVWHVIHNPNERGKACNFEQQGVKFPYQVSFGLPKFPNYRLGPLDGSPCDTLGIDNNPIARFRWNNPNSTNPLKVPFVDLSDYEPTEWLWEFEPGITSRDTNPEYTFPAPGVYDVCLTVSNANSSHTVCKTVPIDVTSLNKEINTANIRLFPNPATDLIKIQLPIYFQSGTIEIFDLKGKKLVNQPLMNSENRIDVSLLPKGLFAYRIKSQNEILDVGKLVIAR